MLRRDFSEIERLRTEEVDVAIPESGHQDWDRCRGEVPKRWWYGSVRSDEGDDAVLEDDGVIVQRLTSTGEEQRGVYQMRGSGSMV